MMSRIFRPVSDWKNAACARPKSRISRNSSSEKFAASTGVNSLIMSALMSATCFAKARSVSSALCGSFSAIFLIRGSRIWAKMLSNVSVVSLNVRISRTSASFDSSAACAATPKSRMQAHSEPASRFFTAIPLVPSHPLDDGSGAHAGADAQRHQPDVEVAALELVHQRTKDHSAGGAERMPQCDGAAVDVDLLGIDVHRLQVAQHDRREGLVDLDEVDVVERHAGALEHLPGDVDRAGEHHGRLRADVGKGLDLGARLEAAAAAGLLVADQDG